MCGFCGILNQEQTVSPALLKQMQGTMIHRGPDEEGNYIDRNLGLGFRRLQVIDLKTGSQPLSNEDGNLWLVCNGEIYNFQELRENLKEKGHRFRTQSDVEVILHLYEEYGEQCLQELRGMFAFVLWDKREGTLFAARDRFGIKPFFYFFDGPTLAVASEAKALLELPQVSRAADKASFSHYLTYQYVPEPKTMFRDIAKLPPAHYFTCKAGEKPEPKRYWQAVFTPQDRPLEDFIEETRAVLREAVALHLISDVPRGCFLSGGIDSSLTSALAAELQPLSTFSVGYADTDYSELAEARATARYLATDHHEYIITPQDFLGNLTRLVHHFDEPVADPAAIALYFVARLAAEKITVTLSGEGADEVFGGYGIYREPFSLAPYKRVPAILRKVLYKSSRILPPVPGKGFLTRGYIPLEDRYFGNAFIFTNAEKKKIAAKGIEILDPRLVTAPLFKEAADYDDVTKMQYIDIHTWMTGDILVKADKMTMANSLELRVPYLDHKVFELAASIPLQYKVHRGQTKYLLRQAFADLLPPEVTNRPKKGFPVPTRLWLKEKRFERFFNELLSMKAASRWLRKEQVRGLYRRHKAGKEDNSRKLWTLLIFLAWLQVFDVEAT